MDGQPLFSPRRSFHLDETRLISPVKKIVVRSKKQHKFKNNQSQITCQKTLVPVPSSDGQCFVSFDVPKVSKKGKMILKKRSNHILVAVLGQESIL